MYKVTLRRVRPTIVAVEISLTYSRSACLYPWLLSLKYACAILSSVATAAPHYLINGTYIETKLLNTKCVFLVSLQLLSETFLILRRTERDMIKNVN
jgi:hypothetical protein